MKVQQEKMFVVKTAQVSTINNNDVASITFGQYSIYRNRYDVPVKEYSYFSAVAYGAAVDLILNLKRGQVVEVSGNLQEKFWKGEGMRKLTLVVQNIVENQKEVK